MNIFASWEFYAAGISYMIFMAAVGALEAPSVNSSPFYSWLYRFLNALAMNLKDAASTRLRLLSGEQKQLTAAPVQQKENANDLNL